MTTTASSESRLIVNRSNSSAYGSIQNAIDNASDEDIIEVHQDTYRETISIDKNLTVIAPEGAVLNGSEIGGNVKSVGYLDEFNFTYASPDRSNFTTGVSIANSASPVIDGFTIANYTFGVSAKDSSGAWTIRNSKITKHSAAGIEASNSSGDWHVQNTSIGSIGDGNVSTNNPGVDARGSSGNWQLENVSVYDIDGGRSPEETVSEGVEALGSSGNWSITDSSIRNIADLGVDMSHTSGSWLIRGSHIMGVNFAGVGGINSSGHWSIRDTVIRNVTGYGAGVAVFNAKKPWVLQNVTIQFSTVGIRAPNGQVDWHLKESRIQDIQAEAVQVWNSTGNWSIQNTVLADTRRGVHAGRSKGDWTIDNSRIEDTDAEGIFADHASGDWRLLNTTITNTTHAGVDVDPSYGSWLIRNTSITGTGSEGVHANDSAGDWVISNSTISATAGDGVYAVNSTSNWSILDTTIADNGRGVQAARTSGQWMLWNVSIANSRSEGVFADAASGNWSIVDSTIHNSSLEGVDVDPSSGNWTILDSAISSSGTHGVQADDSIGDWLIADTEIVGSGSHGVVALNSIGSWSIDNSSIVNSSEIGIVADEASGPWAVTQSVIANNSIAGVVAIDSRYAGNATLNYWGAADGPSGVFNGSGDAVFGNVTVTPFYVDITKTNTSTKISRTGIHVNQSDPSNFDSIQEAVRAANEGGTVIVHAGVYNESVKIDKEITIISETVHSAGQPAGLGAPADAPVLDSDGTRFAAFDIEGDVTDVRIEGLRIQNYKNGIRAWNNGTRGALIRHNTIKSVVHGILVGGDPNIEDIGTGPHVGWIIESNEVIDPVRIGLEADNLVNSSVRDNHIRRVNISPGKAAFSFALAINANNETVENVSLQNNSVTGSYDNFGINIHAGFRPHASSGTITDVEVVGNIVQATFPDDGISVSAGNDSEASRVKLIDNTVKNTTTERPGIGVLTTGNGHVESIVIRNNSATKNEQGFGIRTYGNGSNDNISVINNSFTENVRYGVWIADGTAGTGLEIHDNNITGNQRAGLRHEGTAQVNASRNWWGASDGPSGVFNGSGDAVYGNVSVRPFYSDKARTSLATNISRTALVVNQSDPNAFNSIQEAVSIASKGDTIVVHPGIYNESIQIDRSVTIVSESIHSDGETSAVGAPETETILDSNGSRSIAFRVKENVSNLRIEGFTIRDYRWGVQAWNSKTTNISIRHNTIMEVQEGLLVGSPDSRHTEWIVESNRIVNASFDGIDFFRMDLINSSIRNNEIQRAPNLSNETFSVGLSIVGSAENVAIANNTVNGTFDNNISTGISLRAGARRSGTLNNITVANNHISGNVSGDGIFLGTTNDSTVSDVDIRQNTVRNATRNLPAITIRSTKGSQVTGIRIENNSVTRNANGIAVGVRLGPVRAVHGPLNGSYADITITENRISNNSQLGIQTGRNVSGAALTVKENRITNNGVAGLRHPGSGQVEATHNWWGASDGPSGVYNGSGDAVFGNVTVSPFYTDADRTILSTDLARTGLVVNKSDPSKFHSIQNAVDTATSGDMITVTSGIYNETVHIDKPITIVGESGGPGAGAAADAPVLDSNGSRFAAFALADTVTDVDISGFRIREYQWGIWGWNDRTANITVRHNTIQDVQEGVLVGSPDSHHDDWLVASNHIVNASLAGFDFFRMNLTDTAVRNNEIQRGANISDEPFSVGVSVAGTAENVSILNNRIDGTYDNPISGGITVRSGLIPRPVDPDGEQGVISNMSIAGNRLSGNISGSGIHLTTGVQSPATEIDIVNNTVRNATTVLPAIDIVSEHDGLIDSVIVRNNSLTGNEYGVGVGFGWGSGVPNGSYSDIRVVENEITRNRAGVFVSPNGSGDALAVHQNTIESNRESGLRNNGTGSVNATLNWWGASDGPSGDFNGSGDSIFGNVTVRPFYTDENLTTRSNHLKVTNASLSRTTITVNEGVNVSAIVENTGSVNETGNVSLIVDDELVQSKSVDVPGNSNATVYFAHSFDAAGEFEVVVNDISAGNVTVEAVTTVDEGQPGFGVGLAVVAVLLAVLLPRRRE